MWKHGELKTVLILMPLAFAFAVALDIYIPAVPQLVVFFDSTPAHLQATLSFFVLFFGLGQLFVGPCSDQFGRRSIALLSCFVYLISSVACALSNTITMLIISRVAEALGACGMMVSANAIVRDIFNERDSARVYSYLNGAIAMSPLFAPLLGGYLDLWFGWRACFVVLAIFAALAIGLVILAIPETHHKPKRTKVEKDIILRYVSLFKNKEFCFYLYCAGAGIACLFTFFSISPYLLIQGLHVKEQYFGYYFGVMGLLFLSGSIIAGRTVNKMGVFRNTLVGAIFILIGGAWMALWFLHSGLTRSDFILPMVPISLGAAFLIGSAAAGAMAPFAKIAGTAAAMLGCFQFLFASLVGSLVVYFGANNTLPLGIAVSILGIVACLYWCYIAAYRRKNTRQK